MQILLIFTYSSKNESITHVFFSTGPSPSFKTSPHKLPAFDRFLNRAKAAMLTEKRMILKVTLNINGKQPYKYSNYNWVNSFDQRRENNVKECKISELGSN